MRALRERVFAEQFPQHAHDLGLLRRLTIERALRESGSDPALASAAYAIFFRERNRVDFYPMRRPACSASPRACRWPRLTNGNADLGAIGIAPLFVFQLSAREYGAAKPDAGIFHAACKRLGLPPHEVLHVGDHPRMDVAGAAAPACAPAGSTAATTPGRRTLAPAPTCTSPPSPNWPTGWTPTCIPTPPCARSTAA
jgi:FMN phosphatase YigB (HAD superfamily)